MMRQAGIAVWMLTGDKQETAINIGKYSRVTISLFLHVILTRNKGNSGH